LREIKPIEYTCGLSVVIVGLGLYSYSVRELMVSLALFTGVFFLLSLLALGVSLVYWVGHKVAIWATPASRTVASFSRRLLAAYAKA
jgi:hypothetical protein